MASSLSEELARASDRIVNLILHSDLEWIDIEIEADKMRQQVREAEPERLETFEMIYPPRFRRIWSQWRDPDCCD
jgi:hypothetical protein